MRRNECSPLYQILPDLPIMATVCDDAVAVTWQRGCWSRAFQLTCLWQSVYTLHSRGSEVRLPWGQASERSHQATAGAARRWPWMRLLGIGLLVWVMGTGIVAWGGWQDDNGVAWPLRMTVMPGRSLLIWTIVAPHGGYSMVNSSFYHFPRRTISIPWVGIFLEDHITGTTTRLFSTMLPTWPAVTMGWLGFIVCMFWSLRKLRLRFRRLR